MPRKPIALVLLQICLLIAFGAAAAPPRKDPPSPPKPPSAENPVMELGTFDPARPLPSFYAGNVIELSYLVFSDRRRKDTPPAGLYAFILPDAAFTYDPDAGLMRLNLPARTAHREGSSELLTAFRTTNAMPADSLMTGMNGCARDGAPPTYNILIVDRPLNLTQLGVPMPREKAEEAQPHLRALVAVRLDADAGQVFTQSPEDVAAAGPRYTARPLKAVRKLRDCELALGGNLELIRVYDFRTGEVHATFTLAELD